MTETKSISISVHSPSKSDIKSMNGNTRAMDKNSSPRASLLRNKSEVQLKSNSLLDKYFNRKDHMDEIKRLLKEIPNHKLSNRLYNMVQEMYMDAEYRERTSTQMRDTILKL